MLALKNLRRNPLRSALTTLGVAMGVAMLVAVTGYSNSIGSQLHDAVTNRFQLVVMSDGARSPMSSRIPAIDVARIRQVNGIAEARAVMLGSTRVEQIPFFLIVGVSSSATIAHNVSLIEGRWMQTEHKEIMLGIGAARQLRLGIGERLELQRQDYEITGVYQSPSNILNQAGIVGIANAQALLDIRERVNLVFVKLQAGKGIKGVSGKFSENFPHLRMSRTVDFLGHLEFFVVVERISGALGLIAVVFCILITTNTLLMSFSERRREIAILMAIGWSRTMIARTLVLESVLISFGGALLGIAIGQGVIYRYSQSDIPRINWGVPQLSTEFLLVVFGLAVIIAAFSALYPVYLASRLSPAQILHRE
ncbi:MAG: ABC transporter permease [Gammaproteobacteria bacterium]|nr:ABC transporter permease [Gammaproteobacteria bacterium]